MTTIQVLAQTTQAIPPLLPQTELEEGRRLLEGLLGYHDYPKRRKGSKPTYDRRLQPYADAIRKGQASLSFERGGGGDICFGHWLSLQRRRAPTRLGCWHRRSGDLECRCRPPVCFT